MEITALDSALVFLQEAAADPTPREVRICLDSHSALGRLREGPAAQRDVVVDRVWQRLRDLSDRGTHLTLQWVPRHASLPGNAMADKVALCGCKPESTRSSREPPVSKGHAEEARPPGMEGARPIDQTPHRPFDTAGRIQTATASDNRTTQLARSVETRPRHWVTY